MPSRMFNACLLAICFSSASIAVPAQEVVHALSGTISAVNPADKTITVTTDDGSDGTFKDMTDTKTRLEFDKGLRAGSTPAAAFKDTQGRVVIFYFGEGEIRTAVALRDLGPGPFNVATGSIVSFDKRVHSFSIKDTDGTTQSFKIAPSSIADVGSGATEGLKFEAAKGVQVRVVSSSVNGTPTAMFVVVLAGQ